MVRRATRRASSAQVQEIQNQVELEKVKDSSVKKHQHSLTTVDDVDKYPNPVLVQLMVRTVSNVENQDIFPSCARPAYKRTNEAIRSYQKSASEYNIHLIKMV